MNVRRPPGIVVVLPRIGAGLDGDELVLAVVVGAGAAATGEVGIERRVMLVAGMMVATRRVALPDLQHRPRYRLAVLVEHAAMDHDAFAQRFADALPGEVVLQRIHPLAAERRAGDLRQALRQHDRGLLRRARRRRLVGRRQIGGMLARGGALVGVLFHAPTLQPPYAARTSSP